MSPIPPAFVGCGEAPSPGGAPGRLISQVLNVVGAHGSTLVGHGARGVGRGAWGTGAICLPGWGRSGAWEYVYLSGVARAADSYRLMQSSTSAIVVCQSSSSGSLPGLVHWSPGSASPYEAQNRRHVHTLYDTAPIQTSLPLHHSKSRLEIHHMHLNPPTNQIPYTQFGIPYNDGIH